LGKNKIKWEPGLRSLGKQPIHRLEREKKGRRANRPGGLKIPDRPEMKKIRNEKTSSLSYPSLSLQEGRGVGGIHLVKGGGDEVSLGKGKGRPPVEGCADVHQCRYNRGKRKKGDTG